MTLSVFQSSVVNNSGDVQAGAEIEVVNEATGEPADLYSTRAGAVTTNPMFADADGFFRFYTDAGEYRITATSGPFSKTFRYVRVGDSGGKDASRVARGGDFMAYGGTANAFTLTSVNTLPSTSIQDGDKLRFKATATNTGSATVTIDGGTVLTCKTPTGVNLPAGFIRTDVFTDGEVDGANFVVSRKVENGSNVSGEWTRWEDGTLHQNISTDLTYAAAAVLRKEWTYPIAMVNTNYMPVITFGGTASVDESRLGSERVQSKATTSARFEFITQSNVFSPGDSYSCDLSVSGKWY